jgi:hypothetical protein
MKYRIEQKVATLAENAVNVTRSHPEFTMLGIKFTQWEFNHADGWLGDAWLAEAMVEAKSLKEAREKFRKKMVKIMPRVSFVGQCYTNFSMESFIIVRDDLDVAFFYDIFESGHTGLMFMNEQHEALRLLVKNKDVPEEFYLYWNDATNSMGYTAKLLLIYAAIEALCKKPNDDLDYPKIEKVLGKKLKTFSYRRNIGLRHRLSHGEHFSRKDFKENYVDSLHKAVTNYFNTEVLKGDYISETIVNPQRHPLDNRSLGKYFIKPIGEAKLNLKDVMEDFSNNEDLNDRKPTKYDYFFDDMITKSF